MVVFTAAALPHTDWLLTAEERQLVSCECAHCNTNTYVRPYMKLRTDVADLAADAAVARLRTDRLLRAVARNVADLAARPAGARVPRMEEAVGVRDERPHQ